MKTIEKVCDFEGNIRLDVFVAEIGEITRSRAAKLIEEGFVPEEDIWLFSSVNEENSGGGAIDAAKYLKEKGIRLNAVLDEGVYDLADELFVTRNGARAANHYVI